MQSIAPWEIQLLLLVIKVDIVIVIIFTAGLTQLVQQGSAHNKCPACLLYPEDEILYILYFISLLE